MPNNVQPALLFAVIYIGALQPLIGQPAGHFVVSKLDEHRHRIPTVQTPILRTLLTSMMHTTVLLTQNSTVSVAPKSTSRLKTHEVFRKGSHFWHQVAFDQ